MAAHLLLFGDQAIATLPALRSLYSRSRSSVLLRTFLQDATDIIRAKANECLDSVERSRFFNFHTFADLAERHEAAQFPNHIVNTILLAVTQLGELILNVSYPCVKTWTIELILSP